MPDYCTGMVLSVQSTYFMLVLWPYMEWCYPGWCYYKIKECVTYPEMFIHHPFLPFWDILLATDSKTAFNASGNWCSSSIFELSDSVAQSLFPLCNWYLTWLISLCAMVWPYYWWSPSTDHLLYNMTATLYYDKYLQYVIKSIWLHSPEVHRLLFWILLPQLVDTPPCTPKSQVV